MADDDIEKTKKQTAAQRLGCFGGWAFLLLGYAFISIIPATLCFVTIGIESVPDNDACCDTDTCDENSDYFCNASGRLAGKAASIAMFIVTMISISFGLVMSIVWCRRAKYSHKDDLKEKLTDKPSETIRAPSSHDVTTATMFPPLTPGTSSGYHSNLTSSNWGGQDKGSGNMYWGGVSTPDSESMDSNGN